MGPSEAMVRATVDAMVSGGFVAAGYKYLNLDDGIVEAQRDANGDLVADKTGFPNGFKVVSDYVHQNGMLFGVYTDRGTETCGGRAGALGHEVAAANFYARNGIDYLKEDSCYGSGDHQTAFSEYAAMRDALNATGRPFFFSLCGWEQWYAPVCHALGNSCRIGNDDTNWAGVLGDIDSMAPLWPYAGPGGFNDPCLLLGRDHTGAEAVTDQQGRAQFSMWAVMSAPMLLSSNVRNLTDFQRATYLNPEVIAIGQDELGRQGQRLVGGPLSGGGDGNTPATMQQCAAGSDAQQWVADAPATGYLQNPGSSMCLNTDDCGGNVIMFQCLTTGGTCCGAACLDVLKFSVNANGTLTTPSQQGNCARDSGSGTQLTLEACAPGSAAQLGWALNADKTVTHNGLCLTAGRGGAGNGTAVANVWGKTLSDGGLALVFINADPLLAANLTCDTACLGLAGWEPAQQLSVRDLWARADVAPTTAAAGLSVTNLPANGGVAMFKLLPSWAK
jgi:hypothetical protein